MTDSINHNQYKKGGIECIEAIKAATVGKTGIEASSMAQNNQHSRRDAPILNIPTTGEGQ